MQEKNSFFSSRKKLLALSIVLLVVAGFSGFLFTDFVMRTGDELERVRVESLASTAAASINAAHVANLAGVAASDTRSQSFYDLRDQLARVRDVNRDFRFVYLMRPNSEGKSGSARQMIFLADAEAIDSPDYSAPGDIYDGPSEGLFGVYDTGKPIVEPPSHDRWGYWVTGVAPIKHPETGQVIAVLGMDIRADSWIATNQRYRNFAIAISALLTALVLLFLLGLYLQEKSAARLARQLLELERAQEGLRLADVVVKHTGEGIVVLDANLKIQSVNPGFERVTGYLAKEVLGRDPQILEAEEHSNGIFSQISSNLQSGDHWEGTLWARRKGGDNFPMEANVDVVHADDGSVLHHVLVFHDATVQKKLEDRLRELSATDGLTLVANRRTFDEVLEREWYRAMRNNEPVSLIMADIDMFKSYNDLYGHIAGDECLRKVAQAISDSAQRGGDLVARYGGEEFAVILPNTNEKAAKEIAEKIRLAVEALQISHDGNLIARHITISLGVSTRVPPQTTDFISLMESADKALYRAKEGGRNAVAS
jgi:diguanylate cyclase (GGDEF)-like protein/PAS domain S-box-containing protein